MRISDWSSDECSADLCLLAWLGCRRLGWRRLSGLFLAVLLLYGGTILLPPLPELAVRSLENRFPVPAVAAEAVAGIVVLGGSTDAGAVPAARGQPSRKSVACGTSVPGRVDRGGCRIIKKKTQ